MTLAATSKSTQLIEQENLYGAHNYHPLDVVCTRGEGVHLIDVEGKQYMDFLAAYSAVNQGHNHPRIAAAMIIKTIPGNGWWSAFRIYGPQAPAFDGTWKLNDIVEVK